MIVFHDILVAAVTAAGISFARSVRETMREAWRVRSPPADALPDFFEPDECAQLPLHAWDWSANGETGAFRCPVCTLKQKDKRTPPYCAERDGHFHFKCDECGYEWAMGTFVQLEAARVAAKALERTPVKAVGTTVRCAP